jgi:predicted DNA-binding protein
MAKIEQGVGGSQKSQIDTISIKIPHALVEALDKIAGEQDRSRSALIRRIVSDYMEDRADLQIGLKALERMKKNPNRKVYSSEEALEKLGLTKDDIDPSKYDFSDCD